MRMPIRKPGKYTHLKPDPYLTKEKIKELKDKLERMRRIQPRLAEEVKRLASDGDFSENAAYQTSKGRLRGLNQKILDIENHLKSAVVIAHQDNKSVVESEGKQKTFTILGSSETDPLKGIISRNSPIGSSILNKRIGDIVKVKLKNKKVEYKIIKIR